MSWILHNGDCLEVLRRLPDESVHCCVTSPPYFGLRDYGCDGQIGLEESPETYVAKLVEIFGEVKRVLREDGTLWLNLGDSYASGGRKTRNPGQSTKHPAMKNWSKGRPDTPEGLKPKDLIGIPWRVAFALQADGWYLRSDIIWSKPNPMPESVKDRPTRAHEYIFLLSKSEKYFYDYEAIKEPASHTSIKILEQCADSPKKATGRPKRDKQRGHSRRHAGFNDRWDLMSKKEQCLMGRNKRTVWRVATKPFLEEHFAVLPPEIPATCIKAGCPEGGTVLDPFAGAGTTLWVAEQLGVNSIGIELSPEYCKIIQRRLGSLESVLF